MAKATGLPITVDSLVTISGKPYNDNMRSALEGLEAFGKESGLDEPHRLAMFLAQTAHESMGWTYDREVWGPTAAQKRYEGRTDLGNVYQGDGAKYRGYTPMQITGRANTTTFYNWCKRHFPKHKVPNFVDTPELMNTDPWEGLGPIWYWFSGPNGNLNKWADQGDFQEVTRRINGGYNGLSDRYRYYGRAALVLLNNPAYSSVAAFQSVHGLKADGIVGIKTLSVMHQLLRQQPEVLFDESMIAQNPISALINFIISIFKRA